MDSLRGRETETSVWKAGVTSLQQRPAAHEVASVDVAAVASRLSVELPEGVLRQRIQPPYRKLTLVAPGNSSFALCSVQQTRCVYLQQTRCCV